MTFEIADITPGKGSRSQASKLTELPAHHLALLDDPIYATVATMRKSGPPHLTTVWVDRDETHVRMNSAKGRIKDLNLRARPDCSIMLIDPKTPYHWMSIEGKVTEIIDEEDPDPKKVEWVTKHIDDLAEFYVNKRPYPNRAPGEVRVLYMIEPSRIIAFGPPGG